MSKKLVITGSLAILLAVIAGVAVAKHHGRYHHKMHGFHMLKKADVNKDGIITKEELQQTQLKRFKKLDSNGDGEVTVDEVQKRWLSRIEKRAKRMTRRFDANRDGKVTQDEFLQMADRRLYILDLNDDGKITKDELPRFMKRKHYYHHRGSNDGADADSGNTK